MSAFKIVTVGPEHIEKTTLFKKLANPTYQQPSESSFRSVRASEFDVMQSDKLKVVLWNISGDERYKRTAPINLRGANIGIYCLNLNQNLSLDEWTRLITEYTEQFYAENPERPMVLVVTDLNQDAASQELLTKIQRQHAFTHTFINPIYEDAEMTRLRNHILSESVRLHHSSGQNLYFKAREAIPNSLLASALDKLALEALRHSPSTKLKFEKPVNTLVSGLISPEINDKNQLISNFIDQTQAIIPQKNHLVIRAIFAVALSALVIAAAGGIGGMIFALAAVNAAVVLKLALTGAGIFASCAATFAVPYSIDTFFKASPLEEKNAYVAQCARHFNQDEPHPTAHLASVH